mgnify:CR=1 FL=1
MIISVAASVIVGVVNFWKNNSFTRAALAGDALKNEIKARED